jgi:hypothetical protein
MFVGSALKSQKFRDPTVQFTDRVGIENLFFESEPLPFPTPFAATTEIALAIERDYCGAFEGRRQPSRSGMGGMVIDGNHSGFGEHSQGDRERRAWRQGPGKSYEVDVFRDKACYAKAGFDGGGREASRLRPPRQLRLFDRGRNAAVLDYGSRRVAQDSADSEYVQLAFPRFSILAQVSLRATVRLKTGLPGIVSGSTQK